MSNGQFSVLNSNMPNVMERSLDDIDEAHRAKMTGQMGRRTAVLFVFPEPLAL